jgi:hypothetical protein
MPQQLAYLRQGRSGPKVGELLPWNWKIADAGLKAAA